LLALFGAAPTASGVAIGPESAMRCATVYASVKVLSESVAQLPLILYRREAGGGKERASGHPLFELLHDQPNDWTSSFEFRQSMQAAVLRYDHGAFAQIIRVNGRIVELVQLPSASVTVSTDPITREPVYTFNDER